MSAFNELDITCENCGEEFQGTIWTAVHAGEDTELKDLLLGGELNLVQCPACAHVSYQDHFVLYQDPAAELVAYIYPLSESNKEEFLRQTMLSSFKEAQDVFPAEQRIDYAPVLLFGLESLVEMMEQEERRAEQSQIAQILCKENKIPVKILRPSEARRLGLMRVLPGDKEGLEKLLVLNPALDLYAGSLATLKSPELSK